jgi:hypothetical protein
MIVTCKQIESKSEPSTKQVRGKGKRKKMLTFRDEESSGRRGAGEGFERLEAAWDCGGAAGVDVTVPSPPAAAASPLLGFRNGSALGPEETSGQRRGRARTDAAGSGKSQPSRSAGAHLFPAGRPPGPAGIGGALWIGDEAAAARFESMELQAEDGGVGPTCCGKDRGWSG